MDKMNIEQCPETGICSIVKSDGKKVDLMPDEVADVLAAAGDPVALKAALAEADEQFAASLTDEELAQVSSSVQ